MSKIFREVIEHRLGVDPAISLVKQNERRYTSDDRCDQGLKYRYGV
jgi:hypothetical protein